MFKTNEACAVYCCYRVRDAWVKSQRFQEVELYLFCVLGAHDFNHPKNLFHKFEEEIMLVKTRTPFGQLKTS